MRTSCRGWYSMYGGERGRGWNKTKKIKVRWAVRMEGDGARGTRGVVKHIPCRRRGFWYSSLYVRTGTGGRGREERSKPLWQDLLNPCQMHTLQ